MIFRRALASDVELGEADLSGGQILLGGPAKPLHGLFAVLRNSTAKGVDSAEAELSLGVPLFGSLAELLDVLRLGEPLKLQAATRPS